MFLMFFLGQVTREQFPQHTSQASSIHRHIHTHSDVPNSNISQGYRVRTLMVMNDVDTPSHSTNSQRLHKHTQSMKYVSLMVTAGSSG